MNAKQTFLSAFEKIRPVLESLVAICLMKKWCIVVWIGDPNSGQSKMIYMPRAFEDGPAHLIVDTITKVFNESKPSGSEANL